MIYQNSNFRIDIPFTKEEKTLIEKTARDAGLTVENFIRLRLIMSDRICFASKSDRSTAIEATMTMLQSNLSFISEHNGDSSWAGKLNPQIVLNAVGLIQQANEFDDRTRMKVHTAIKSILKTVIHVSFPKEMFYYYMILSFRHFLLTERMFPLLW